MKIKTLRQYHNNIVKAIALVKEAQTLALKLDISDGSMLETAIKMLDGETLGEFNNKRKRG